MVVVVGAFREIVNDKKVLKLNLFVQLQACKGGHTLNDKKFIRLAGVCHVFVFVFAVSVLAVF